MTRRITLAILLTVWAMLIAGGVVAYMATRSILLAELDAALVARAMSLPQVLRPEGMAAHPRVEEGDRYLVQGAARTLARPTTQTGRGIQPTVVAASFAKLADGTRLRTVTLKARGVGDGGDKHADLTITYSGSARGFDTMLNRLALVLALFGLVGGVGAAVLARGIAHRELRPRHETAQTIKGIDERNLSHRVQTQRLPPELLSMGEHLNAMLGRLQEAFEQHKQFMADASHELRTPVAGLVTSLEVALRKEREPAAYRQVLESCLGDARLLRTLVERLMEQIRSERSSAEGRLEPTDVSVLLDQCASVVEPLAGEKQMRLTRNYPPGLTVLSEPPRLRSVVMNLLGNAAEYGRPGGQIELKCEITDVGLCLTVADDGPGIAPEHLPHVFEPFYRGDAVRAAGEHLGLGLALVASHAKALGGRCRVESAVAKGSVFIIELPLAEKPGNKGSDQTFSLKAHQEQLG